MLAASAIEAPDCRLHSFLSHQIKRPESSGRLVLLQAVATVRVSIVLAGHFCILRDQGYQRILLPMSQLPETLQQFTFMQ